MQSSQTGSNRQEPPGISGSGTPTCSVFLEQPRCMLLEPGGNCCWVSMGTGSKSGAEHPGFSLFVGPEPAGEPVLHLSLTAAKDLALWLLSRLPLPKCGSMQPDPAVTLNPQVELLVGGVKR